MMKRIFVMCAGVLFVCPSLFAQPQDILLSKPDIAGGKPLMQALNGRRSQRAFSAREIPVDILSNLLWAADGVNRSDGKRTAPSAGNGQEIDIYVAMKGGVYRYRADENKLEHVLVQDLRALTGKQDFTQAAPVNLIFVANKGRMKYGKLNDFYAAADTGFISQNVYLFCASEGLATVVLGWLDKEELAGKMGLKEGQEIMLTQPVGYPK